MGFSKLDSARRASAAASSVFSAPARRGHDVVLHVEEISEGFIEPLRPEMSARFSIDELHVDAHAVAAALDAALEDIADIQLTTNLLQIDSFAFEGESGVAADHERASNSGERSVVRALGDPVDEMLLFRIAADIGEG